MLHHLWRTSPTTTIFIFTSPNRFWNLSESVSGLLVSHRFFRTFENTGCGVSLCGLSIAVISNRGSLGALGRATCETALGLKARTLVSIWLACRINLNLDGCLESTVLLLVVRTRTRTTGLYFSILRNFLFASSFGKSEAHVDGRFALKTFDKAV